MPDTIPAAEETSASAPLSRKERRLLRLERMSEIGLSISQALEDEARRAAALAQFDPIQDKQTYSRRVDDIARAFAQVSRAVSLSTALEDRIDEGLPACSSERLFGRAHQTQEKRREALEQVETSAEHLVQGERRRVDFRLRLNRLLDREMVDLERFLERPLPEIVAHIQRELGLICDEDEVWGDEALPPQGGHSGAKPGRGGPEPESPPVITSPPRPVSPACSPQKGEMRGVVIPSAYAFVRAAEAERAKAAPPRRRAPRPPP